MRARLHLCLALSFYTKLIGNVLFIEAVSADELAYDTRRGDLVVDVRLEDVVKHLNHSSYLVVALVRGVDGGEQGINVLLYYAKLVKSRAVEDNVGVLLEGIDPSFLAASYGIPHRERSLYR